MDIVEPRIETYLQTLFDDADPVRMEMEALAAERGFPIVGPLVGRHLEVLSRAISARRVFELGSGFGYSALFFARAVGETGEVCCTDLSEENIRQAEGFLTRAGLWERVTYYREDAIAALDRVGGQWDVILNDIDKEAYPQVVEHAYERLRPGGLLITDNVLWYGRVVPGEDDGSPATTGVKALTKKLVDHPGFLTTILPTRDGVAVSLKVG